MKTVAAKPWQASLGSRRRLFDGVRWSRYPWGVLALAVLFLVLGATLVLSMSRVDELFQRDDVRFASHLKKVAMAAPFLLLGVLFSPRAGRKYAWTVYAGAIVLLLLVPLIGEERNNAKRWIPTPIRFDLQPSEFAKVALVIVLARVLHVRRMTKLSDWFVVAGLALLPMGLVMAQPDLGTALTMVPIAVGMAYLAGGSGRVIAGVVAVGLALGVSAWQFQWVQDYQLRRIDTWASTFEPSELIADKNGQSFHVYHARVCVGNGGMDGTGLGDGLASRAGYLPERESDSIFCVVAEEGGFALTSLFVALYVGLIVLLLRTAAAIRERFTRLVVGGVALYFAAHFFINTGVNLGLLPMTGLTLPLLSTGGSSMLATFAALGVALGFAAQQVPSLDEDAFKD
ncbi:Peptidoglycan glycosyltransferase MrdB [Planctomycetes bacterium Pla163]|uniref:Probable peptidoglycan glycosyltransferase FtsW n=1 Tax=Rohdeia mirabilis TaxID=2528008 RepID=A0A518D3B6_9BACT|nr:Peptidoglycan glycosyltransferase MrdB [Planctomycetes bacterium Pla163]